jgi:hypothetical protein
MKRFLVFALAVSWGVGLSGAVRAQSSIENYIYGSPAASLPLPSSSRVPVVPSTTTSPSQSTMQYIQGNLLATLSDPATLAASITASSIIPTASQLSANLFGAVSNLCGGSTTEFVRGDGTCNVPPGGGGGSLVVGTTPVTGTPSEILYDAAGVLGQLTSTGSGSVALATGATLDIPSINAASFTGTTTVTGSVTLSGLSSGPCTSGLALNGSNSLVTTSCGGGGSVSITAGNAGIVFSPSPLTGTGTASLNIAGGTPITNEFVSGITAAGVVTLTQPTFANLASTPTTLAGYGITSPLPQAQGGLGATSLGAAVSTLCSASTTNFVRGDGTCVAPSGSGTVTSITLSPGFTTTIGTQNTAGQSITTTGTINGQLWPEPQTANYTVLTSDTGAIPLANGASSITFTLPNAATGTKGTQYQFNDESGHGYTLATVGAAQNFLGCSGGGGTTLAVSASVGVSVIDNGTSYSCLLYGGSNSFSGTTNQIVATPNGSTGAAAVRAMVGADLPRGLILASAGYIAGANPNNGGIVIFPYAATLSSITFNPEVASGVGGTTIQVNFAASGTACSGGTNVASGTLNANGTAGTNQTLTLTTTAIASGSRLCVQTGGTWTSSVGAGTITVAYSPT